MWPATLTPWVQKVCFASAEGTLTRLELRQVVHGSPDSLIESWVFTEDTPKVVVGDLSDEITGRAHDDCAEAFEGPTQYTVLAFFDGNEFHGSRAPTTRFASSAKSPDSGFDESEPATPKGLAAQQMRHNEGLVRMLVANTTSTQRHMENLLERSYVRIKNLEDSRYEMIKMTEDMLNRRATRELEETQTREKMVRYDEAWQSARILLPTVVNHVAGRKIMQENRSSFEDTIVGLVRSLRSDQFARIQTILDQSQLVGFTEVARVAMEKDDQARAEAEKAKEAHAARVSPGKNVLPIKKSEPEKGGASA
jgi:hypothetical protein